MHRAIIGLANIFLILGLGAHAFAAPNFIAMTSPLPPYSINKGLHVKGISVDILAVIMTLSGVPMQSDDVKLMLWTHALKITTAGPHKIMLNVPQTATLKPMFKWVGPIDTNKFVVIGRKGGKTINSLADLKGHRVATIRDSLPEKALFESGIKKPTVSSAVTHIIPLKKLDRKMIDFFAYGDVSTTYLMKSMGMKLNKFKVIHTYGEVPLYYAFSKDTPDSFINTLNEKLQKLKKPGKDGKSRYDKIVAKYLPHGVIH